MMSSHDVVRVTGTLGAAWIADEVVIAEPVGDTSGEAADEDAELCRDMVMEENFVVGMAMLLTIGRFVGDDMDDMDIGEEGCGCGEYM